MDQPTAEFGHVDHSAIHATLAWGFLQGPATVVVLRVDRHGIIVAANPYACAMTGRALVGEPWDAMQLNFPGEPSFAEWLQDTVRPRIVNIQTPLGVPQVFEMHVEPVGDDLLMFGQISATEDERRRRDVLELNHELNNLNQERAFRNTELADLRRLQRQFLGMATQDLRKPVGLVTMCAERLLDVENGLLSGKQRDVLETIQRAADRMRRVIDDFLDVSPIDAGRLSLDLSGADLNEIIRNAQTLVHRFAAARHVSITTDLDPAVTNLRVDAPRIEQALISLLSWAIDHSPDGGVVRVTSWPDERALRLEVADEGPGIAPDVRARLFEGASRTTSATNRGDGGFGLGLPIARRIVESHGGQLMASCPDGHGSVFTLTLPPRCLGAAPRVAS